jgi:Cu+-exporting ATPase
LAYLGISASIVFSISQFFSEGNFYFEVPIIMVALVSLGKFLKIKNRGRADLTMKQLSNLNSASARVIDAYGKTTERDVISVEPRTTILVKPDEKIPLDGRVIDGESFVDESMLTGETSLIPKSVGSQVYGATMNKYGALTIDVQSRLENCVLSKIIKIVESAQRNKTPIQNLIDKTAKIFVPVNFLIAAITFIAWELATGDLGKSIMPAIAVLMIACPCAIGLAAQTAILIGINREAKEGVLIKSGDALIHGKKINIIMLDKTGTLTNGRPVVVKVIATSYATEKEVIAIAAGIESASNHPIAKAVLEYANSQNIPPSKISGISLFTGRGVVGKLQSKTVHLGSAVFMGEAGISVEPVEHELITFQKRGETVIMLAVDETIIGLLIISDTLKDNVVEAVKTLKKKCQVIMVTGDHARTAQTVAQKLGIGRVEAEASPYEKQQIVKRFQKNGKYVAFIGDGINDIPAIAQADLGIAVGNGTEIAAEAGQIVLVGGGLEKVAEIIQLSKKTNTVIRQNLFWATVYNAVGIPLAALGFLHPIVATAAMTFSSVSVILNSLRLRK